MKEEIQSTIQTYTGTQPFTSIRKPWAVEIKSGMF